MSQSGIGFCLFGRARISTTELIRFAEFWSKVIGLPVRSMHYLRKGAKSAESYSAKSNEQDCPIVQGDVLFDDDPWSTTVFWNAERCLLGATASDNRASVESLINAYMQVAQVLAPPDYGFVCAAPPGYASSGYLDGITHCTGSRLPLFERKTMLWFNYVERLLEARALRIYPATILGPRLANLQLRSGMAVTDWIGMNSSHGRLRKIDHGAWLWTVDQGLLEKIEDIPGREGLLIEYVPPEIAIRLK